jgi:hypothetical protein
VLDKLCLSEETGLPTDLSQGFEYEKHHGFRSGPHLKNTPKIKKNVEKMLGI